MFAWFRKFESNQVFTRDEAWSLFRLAAIAEACGWSLLICGILLQKYVWPESQLPVYFAGRTHGMLFLAYMLAAIGLYPNLQWPRWKALLALAASVPPFGSLIFEQLEQYYKQTTEFKNYRRCIALAVIAQ